MNRIYRLIWCEATATWTAVAEIVSGRGRRASGICRKGAAVTLGLLLLAPGIALAAPPAPTQLPTGGQIVAGSGNISQSGTAMTVTQNTGRMIANWQGFDIGSRASVTFLQPGSASVALNRILSQNPTQIMGHLTANGQVMLVNPAGILFGRGSQVNVGAITASTLDIANQDFLAGIYRFTNPGGAGAIDNQGRITTADGGVVALIAPVVHNEGEIDAPKGSALLAAGDQITLDFGGDGLITYLVDAGTAKALVENTGTISADGGLAVMTAKAADDLSQAVVNNQGVVRAQTLASKKGRILLLSDMANGTTEVGGTLDASAPDGGDGGRIETSGHKVRVADDAHVTTAAVQGNSGDWLIDPADFTIAASGGDMTGSTLTTNLTGGNVTIQSNTGGSGSNGDINVDDTVSWNANSLILYAARDININAVMTATGTASLDLNTAGTVNCALGGSGFTGRVDFSGAGTLSINSSIYTVIDSLGAAGSSTTTDLQGMNGALAGHYALGKDIDASATSGWNTSQGFTPIGSNAFTGVFDGLGHTITGLSINRPGSSDIGLFGAVGTGGAVRNVGLVGGSVTGDSCVGGLVGLNSNGTISNAYATGTVSGSSYVGGLVGSNNNGSTISNSYATGTVNGSSNVGGLAGGNSHGSTISNSYAAGTVSGSGTNNSNVGGLVGGNSNSTISNSYATGTVSGSSNVGGLVGYNSDSATVTDSHATGNVNGSGDVGGLAGFNDNNSTISNSYATGAVTGSGANTSSIGVGGLVGFNSNGTITDSYATGAVTGSGANTTSIGVGGLVGRNYGTITDSYATGAVTGSGANGVGGLVGINNHTITDSYATGSVTGTGSNAHGVGGLVGINYSIVSNAYATGSVTGTGSNAHGVGGLVGINSSMISNAYWDSNTTHQATGVGGNLGIANIGALTTTQALQSGSYTGFDFTTTWYMVDGATRPFLRSEYSTTITNAHQLQLMAMALAASYTLANDIDLTAHFRNPSDMWATDTNSASGAGFAPIGNIKTTFSGSFDGQGHTITNLYINRPSENYVGLFGFVGSSGLVRGVGLVDGSVTGGINVGDLAGNSYYGTITAAYATGSVSGTQYVGGLVGANNDGTVTDAYATGSVSGTQYVGGLVGINNGVKLNAISDSYATGSVSGTQYVGGLVGINSNINSNAITDAYWNTETSGTNTGIGSGITTGATGLTTADMKAASTFAGWSIRADGTDHGEPWRIYEGNTYPLLTAFLTPVTVTTSPSKTYDGQAYGGAIAYTVPAGTDPSKISGALSSTGVNAGTYSLSGLLYSDQQGYDITVSGHLTINPKTVSLSATKTYDGTTDLAGDVTVTTGVSSETLTYTGATASDAHVATNGKYVSAITLADGGNGGVASNYRLPTLNAANAPVTITARTLTATLTNTGVTKVYDGSTSAPSGFTPSWSFSGLAGGDTGATLSNTGAAYDSKNVSATKVTVAGLAITAISGSKSSAASDYVLDANSKEVAASITPAPNAGTPAPNPGAPPSNKKPGTTAAAPSPDPGSAANSGGSTNSSGNSMNSGSPGDSNAGTGKDVPAPSNPPPTTPAGLPGTDDGASSPGTPGGGTSSATTGAWMNPSPLVDAGTDGELAGGGGGAMAISLSISGNTTMLTMGAAGSGGGAGNTETASVDVPVFNQSGASLAPADAIAVNEQGQTIQATPGAAPQTSIPAVNEAGMQMVTVDYQAAGGNGANPVTVGISPDGILLVKVSGEMESGMNENSLVLVGISIAQTRLNVKLKQIKGVVMKTQ